MVQQRLSFIPGLLLMACSLYSTLARASTYYVATDGTDTSSCVQAQSKSTPKQTLNDAIGCLTAGDTLLVRGGVYNETLEATALPSGTSWDNKVRIAAYPSEVVTLRPPSCLAVVSVKFAHHVELDGINLDARNCTSWAVKIEGYGNAGQDPHHIRIQNAVLSGPSQVVGQTFAVLIMVSSVNVASVGGNEFINLKMMRGPGATGFRTDGFYLQMPNNLVEHCDVSDMIGFGLQTYNENPRLVEPDNNTIRYNRFHDFPDIVSPTAVQGAPAVNIAQGTGNKVYGNLIYNLLNNSPCCGYGISVMFGGSNAEIYNNTVFGVVNTGILVSSGTGTIVRNNISYGNGGGDYSDGGSGTVASDNLFGINPRFVSPTAGDFHLQAGSPAIDTGATIPLVVTDLSGVRRAQGSGYDMGAYEWSTGTQVGEPSAPTGLRVVSN